VRATDLLEQSRDARTGVLYGEHARPVRRQLRMAEPGIEGEEQSLGQQGRGNGEDTGQLRQRVGHDGRHSPIEHVLGLDMPQFASQDIHPLLFREQIHHRGRYHDGMALHTDRDGARLRILAEVEFRLRHIEDGTRLFQIPVEP